VRRAGRLRACSPSPFFWSFLTLFLFKVRSTQFLSRCPAGRCRSFPIPSAPPISGAGAHVRVIHKARAMRLFLSLTNLWARPIFQVSLELASLLLIEVFQARDKSGGWSLLMVACPELLPFQFIRFSFPSCAWSAGAQGRHF